MAKPEPKPIDPDQLVKLARRVMEADRFPYLATIDEDQARVRPVSPVRTDGFTVYVANLRSYHKTTEGPVPHEVSHPTGFCDTFRVPRNVSRIAPEPPISAFFEDVSRGWFADIRATSCDGSYAIPTESTPVSASSIVGKSSNGKGG